MAAGEGSSMGIVDTPMRIHSPQKAEDDAMLATPQYRIPHQRFLDTSMPEILNKTADAGRAEKLLLDWRLPGLHPGELDLFVGQAFPEGRSREAMERVRAAALDNAVRAIDRKIKAQDDFEREMPMLTSEMDTLRKARAKAAERRTAKAEPRETQMAAPEEHGTTETDNANADSTEHAHGQLGNDDVNMTDV
ncbi:MAG: hypothetical protein M1833_005896 [Piccolia ochrophora]|nr:MAG: hypothetical protein M1833_005896 [Piccolia ochrophora]